MQILELTPEVYEKYKREVKNNETTTYDQACRKVTRNIQLAREHAPDRIKKFLGKTTYWYGNLCIKVKGKRVVGIENVKGDSTYFSISKKRYYELTKELGIISSK